jgi:hypothetical protein
VGVSDPARKLGAGRLHHALCSRTAAVSEVGGVGNVVHGRRRRSPARVRPRADRVRPFESPGPAASTRRPSR